MNCDHCHTNMEPIYLFYIHFFYIYLYFYIYCYFYFHLKLFHIIMYSHFLNFIFRRFERECKLIESQTKRKAIHLSRAIPSAISPFLHIAPWLLNSYQEFSQM